MGSTSSKEAKASKHRVLEQARIDLPQYVYQDLKRQGYIRSVTVLGITPETIECALKHQKVSRGGYQALSYVWGSPEKIFRATVRDNKGRALGFIPLTKNLNSALRDLWASSDIECKTFWIDQICINQEGKEKSQQVAMMGRIYKSAARVITYTSPAEENPALDERGIKLMASLCEHFAPNFEIFSQGIAVGEIREVRAQFPVGTLSNEISSSATEDDWQWLVRLCLGEWASRVWIIQEQLLNEENWFLFGQRLLPWDDIMSMAVLWCFELLPIGPVLRYWHDRMLHLGPSPWHVAQSVYAIWSKRKTSMPNQNAYILLSNLGAHGILECQDPRDRIFALLGVSLDAAELDIKVDYSKPAAQLFHEVSVSILRRYPSFNYLAFVTTLDNLAIPGAPSWALSYPRHARYRGNGLQYHHYTVHPRRDSTRPARFRCNHLVLVGKGRIVDQISKTRGPHYQSDSSVLQIPDEAALATRLEMLEDLRKILSGPDFNQRNAAALAQALVASAPWTPADGGGSEIHHLFSYLRQIALPLPDMGTLPDQAQNRFDERIRGPNRFISTVAFLLAAEGIKCTSVDEPMSPAEHVMAMNMLNNFQCNGRTFCITEKGRVCTVSNVSNEGDVIAAFEGSDRFFALRRSDRFPDSKNGPKYLVIGDAWVDGLMNGEAYAGLDPDEVDYDIELA